MELINIPSKYSRTCPERPPKENSLSSGVVFRASMTVSMTQILTKSIYIASKYSKTCPDRPPKECGLTSWYRNNRKVTEGKYILAGSGLSSKVYQASLTEQR